MRRLRRMSISMICAIFVLSRLGQSFQFAWIPEARAQSSATKHDIVVMLVDNAVW